MEMRRRLPVLLFVEMELVQFSSFATELCPRLCLKRTNEYRLRKRPPNTPAHRWPHSFVTELGSFFSLPFRGFRGQRPPCPSKDGCSIPNENLLLVVP